MCRMTLGMLANNLYLIFLTFLFTFRKMFVGGLSWQTTEGIFQISKTNQLEIDSSRGTQRILFQVWRSL